MKVKNFAGFMKTRRLNESEDQYGMSPEDDMNAGYYGAGANPEEEEEGEGENEEGEEGETEELSLESLKAMIDDLTERVKKLEPEEEEEEGEGENEEGEEGEAAEGEAAPAE